MISRVKNAWRWAVDSYVLFVVLGIVLGVALVPLAVGLAGSPDGTVAVVHIDGSINGDQATSYSSQLATARQEADAVVLVANSGGGSAPASEEMYMQTVRTEAEMPVVATVDAAAASGAYYAIAPAEEIYVKPASTVGSVGVIAQAPPRLEPNDLFVTTGPNKLSGGDSRQFAHGISTVQNAFLSAVYDHREERLALERSELANAGTYTGINAVENGLADEVGGRERAVSAAASKAGLDQPEVVVMRPNDAEATFLMRSTYLASDAAERELTDAEKLRGGDSGVPNYLMVPRAAVATDATVVSGQEATEALDRTDETARASDDAEPSPANSTSMDASLAGGVTTSPMPAGGLGGSR